MTKDAVSDQRRRRGRPTERQGASPLTSGELPPVSLGQAEERIQAMIDAELDRDHPNMAKVRRYRGYLRRLVLSSPAGTVSPGGFRRMTKLPRIVLPLTVALLTLGAAENAFAAGSAPSGTPPAIHAAILCPSRYVNARVLAANTAETETAPTFTGFSERGLVAVFSATCANWYYSITGTAAVPAADVTDGGAAFRAPTALRMRQGGTLSIVADATCTVTTAYSFDTAGACE